MNKNWITTLVAGAAIGAIAVAAVTLVGASGDGGSRTALAATPDTSESVAVRTITVEGVGTTTVKPDTARLDIGVSVTAPTAQGALKQAAEAATNLIATLKGAGIADDDIKTSNVSLYPRYDDSYQNITGYNVSNSVTVTVRDVSKVGPVIDAAAGVVGDAITLNGVSFYVDNDAAALATARDAAIDDAKLRAGQFSKAAGASVGQVLTISEVSTSAPQPVYYETAASDAGAAPSTPIQSGTQDVVVNVTVTYQLD